MSLNITPALHQKYCLEKGPGGQFGVWTRNGGDYAFFTPLEEIQKREQAISHIKPVFHDSSDVESKEDYYKRKLNSHEWMG